jgi:hypothetical protein
MLVGDRRELLGFASLSSAGGAGLSPMSASSGANASMRARASRAFERRVAEKEPHWPRLCDLHDFIKIARRAIPVADVATESGAGKEAARDITNCPAV